MCKISSVSKQLSRKPGLNPLVFTAQKQQSHGDADDKAQPPLRITVPAVKHRSPKYTAL